MNILARLFAWCRSLFAPRSRPRRPATVFAERLEDRHVLAVFEFAPALGPPPAFVAQPLPPDDGFVVEIPDVSADSVAPPAGTAGEFGGAADRPAEAEALSPSVSAGSDVPKVTPAVAPPAENATIPPSPPSFRLTVAAAGVPVTVRYTLSLVGAETTTVVRGEATVPAGATTAAVAVPTPLPAGTEVAVLAVTPTDAYRTTTPTATAFPVGREAASELSLLRAYHETRSAEAFGELVDRHRETVLSASRQVVGSAHDAEDVSQAVFLTLAGNPLRLRTTLAAWLRTVARNASVALLRSRGRRARHEQNAARPMEAPDDGEARELREELDAALSRVSPILREAVTLRYIEGWSQEEAAAIAGCPRGTLSQRAATGLKGLREAMGG